MLACWYCLTCNFGDAEVIEKGDKLPEASPEFKGRNSSRISSFRRSRSRGSSAVSINKDAMFDFFNGSLIAAADYDEETPGGPGLIGLDRVVRESVRQSNIDIQAIKNTRSSKRLSTMLGKSMIELEDLKT